MRSIAASLAALFVGVQIVPGVARADNQIGYHLLSAQDAAALPHHHGALGLKLVRGQVITSDGMTFELLKVAGVTPGGAGAQAGFKVGDQIVAVDGTVFPSLAAFAAYVGSVAPGQPMAVDYIPAGGGPQQAQRLGVTVGNGAVAAPPAPAPSGGLSTGMKLAIGAGAVALFGCYEIGCFSKTTPAAAP